METNIEEEEAIIALAKCPTPGLHFFGQECEKIYDKNGECYTVSTPIRASGGPDKKHLHHFIARESSTVHRCLYPGCGILLKSQQNKWSNGFKHLLREHPETISYDNWDDDMKKTRQDKWAEEIQSASTMKRTSTDAFIPKKQLKIGEKVPPKALRLSISFANLLNALVKFICIGMFSVTITINPGFRFLLSSIFGEIPAGLNYYQVKKKMDEEYFRFVT